MAEMYKNKIIDTLNKTFTNDMCAVHLSPSFLYLKKAVSLAMHNAPAHKLDV